jgi:hypothetical protein
MLDIVFTATFEHSGFIVVALDARSGDQGSRRVHDRNIGDALLRRYEVVAPRPPGAKATPAEERLQMIVLRASARTRSTLET